MAAAAGSMATLVASEADARWHRRAPGQRGRHGCRQRRIGPHGPFKGFGPLEDDPAGILNLPSGFSYRIISEEGQPLSNESRDGLVPSSHDGMGAFQGRFRRTFVVRNHEIDVDDVDEEAKIPVKHVPGLVYDPDGVGGTTTMVFDHRRRLLRHRVSLAGTLDNCAGGVSPWRTWLTCEETTDVLSKPHGYVFEVCPYTGGNPEPIVAMGRFEHEAVAFGRRGEAYLTEDADGPFGCCYRFLPCRRLGGIGSLHAGGELQAMKISGIAPGEDLSKVQTAGLVLPVTWVEVPNVDPGEDETSVREQAIANGATPIQKCEGTWTDAQGRIWIVSSRGDGPDAEDEEDRSTAVHAGQVWRYDPRTSTIELVVIFEPGSPWDGPDNITVSPHGFALVCSDGEDDQWIMAMSDDGQVFPFAFNADNEEEFAGATFSPDGSTLFVNVQGDRVNGEGPAGRTFAIWGPWGDGGSHWAYRRPMCPRW